MFSFGTIYNTSWLKLNWIVKVSLSAAEQSERNNLKTVSPTKNEYKLHVLKKWQIICSINVHTKNIIL